MEVTSSLTNGDLILEASLKLGLSYYGTDGRGAAQIPVDTHDLAECQRMVNNAIRMFIADAPNPNGWRWTRPTASFVVWAGIDTSSNVAALTAVYDAGTDLTTITASDSVFEATMEEKPLVIANVGSPNIAEVTSNSVIVVYGDMSAATGEVLSVESDGNFTLPPSFGGEYLGGITYGPNTNRGRQIEWVDEQSIRRWRENEDRDTGTPFYAAVRPMDVLAPRRRWELMLYTAPETTYVIQFPYHVHFDNLVNTTDVPPSPIGHDETLKAAVKACVEREVNEGMGMETDYYRNVCLPNSYRIDAQSAPKVLGNFGWNTPVGGNNSIEFWRSYLYQRPTVRVNT